MNTDEVILALASILHEDWRTARSHEPRWKADGLGGQVDIAATAFSELPSQWQEENLSAARAAVVAALTLNDGSTEVAWEQAAGMVHDSWLERNGSWAPTDQAVAYCELSEEEKEKDRRQLAIAHRLLKSS